MKSTQPIREARLKLECADHHPTLPALRWTSAAAIADLVASANHCLPKEMNTERTLLEADFDFRGGQRRLAGWVTRTRIGE